MLKLPTCKLRSKLKPDSDCLPLVDSMPKGLTLEIHYNWIEFKSQYLTLMRVSTTNLLFMPD